MKLTTCNNCGSVFEDMNPGDGSIDYPDSLMNFVGELPTIKRDDETVGYGCDQCKTDGYLEDNVNANAGGFAKLLAAYIKQDETAFGFNADDIIGRAAENEVNVPEEDAKEILVLMRSKADVNAGISWDTLDYFTELYYEYKNNKTNDTTTTLF